MMHSQPDSEMKYKPYMGINNITIDVCKYMSHTTSSILFDMLLRGFKHYVNLFQPCPFTKVTYYNLSEL